MEDRIRSSTAAYDLVAGGFIPWRKVSKTIVSAEGTIDIGRAINLLIPVSPDYRQSISPQIP